MGRIQSGVAEREAHSVCDTWDTQPHSSVKIHKGGLSDSLNSEHLVKNCRAGDSRRNQVITPYWWVINGISPEVHSFLANTSPAFLLL